MSPSDRDGWSSCSWLITTGAISILAQVVLLRELQVAFYGSELIYILALGVWLLGTAFGALLGRRNATPNPRHICGLLIALAVLLPGLVVATRSLRLLFGAMPGTYLGFGEQIVGMILVLTPAGLGLGVLFVWAAELYVAPGRLLAAAYGIESIGGLAGGGLGTLLVYLGAQNLTAAMLCGALAIAASWAWRDATLPWRLARVLVAVILVMGLSSSAHLDHALTERNHPRLVVSRDSPYSRTTITRTAGQISVFQNDALAFESEGVDAEELVHLAALQHPAPKRVLLLGGAITGAVTEILQHRPERVDLVELDAVLLASATPLLPERIRQPLRDPAVRISIADPRAFLAEAETYDLILIAMPEPESGQANRFYTREMFRLCQAHLRTRGILALRLRGAENLWTPPEVRRTASILRALDEVFAETLVLPGTANLLLASDLPLAHRPEPLQERLRQRSVTTRLISAPYIEYALTNDRVAQVAGLLAAATAPTNTDTSPVCYQVTLIMWLAKFFPVAAFYDLSTAGKPTVGLVALAAAAALGLAGLFVILRRWPTSRRLAVAMVAGFAGLLLETVLILSYQIQRGVLYGDLGLLLMMFMAGLAGGGLAFDRIAHRREEPGLPHWLGRLLIAVFVLLCLIVFGSMRMRWATGLLGTSVLLAASGFGVAGLFVYASLAAGSPAQARVVSPLYAADLIGGSIGCVTGTLIFIPVLGLGGSSLLVAGLLLVALLVV